MPNIFKYKIYCETDSKVEYVWSDTLISTCPINSSHTVSSSSVTIIRTLFKKDLKSETITSSNSPFELKKNIVYANTSNGNITINLIKAERAKNKYFYIKKTSASNTVTIVPNGSQLVDVLSTKTLTTLNDFVILTSDGTNWTSNIEDNISPIKDPKDDNVTKIKGDIMVNDGDDLAALPIGTDGQVLMVDTNTDFGIKWSIKSEWNASTAPTSTDDNGAGYEVGSRWIDTTANKEYVCLDATSSVAVWIETTQSGGGGGGGGGLTTYYTESDTESTTSEDTNFQQKLRLTLNSVSSGNYAIHWSASLGNNSNKKKAVLRVQLNDSITINECGCVQDSNISYQNICGFKRVNLSNGTHNIDLDYRSTPDGGTAKIKDARIWVVAE